MNDITAIILAAGKSTRMRSALPKVLHKVLGKPLAGYTVDAALTAGCTGCVIVVAEEFKKTFTENFKDNGKIALAVQKEQRGTADAVKAARESVPNGSEYVLIVPGDVPLVKSSTLKNFILDTVKSSAACGVLTMELPEPAQYGRIVRGPDGGVQKIVEARDASPSELLIKEVNSSIYCAKTSWLFEALENIRSENAQKEFYLTDIIGIARGAGLKVSAWCTKDAGELLGTNTRKELSEIGRLMTKRILDELMTSGVSIIDPSSTFIDSSVTVGADTVIHPNCHLRGKTVIGKGCTIDTGAVITDTEIADNVSVYPYTIMEGASVGAGVKIGPFARLRPGAVIEEEAKVGNFVEIKKSVLKKGSKASHLSYIGDAVIGEKTNVGCGMITCNYDGKAKHKTVIGANCFIGSDVQFVAPVEIGENATIAAGSTITENVPANSLAIARSRQVVKKNYR